MLRNSTWIQSKLTTALDRIQFDINLDACQGGKKKGVAAIEDKALIRLKCFMI